MPVTVSQDIAVDLNSYIKECSETAIARNGRFILAISGGSIPKLVHLSHPQNTALYLVDERLVPFDHSESNFLLVKEALGIEPITFDEHLLENPELAAQDYEAKVRSVEFDLVLLGLGPDGHTASLFPNHPILRSENLVDFLEDSPKPPPRRITMTMKLLKNCSNVLFVVSGASKARAVSNHFSNEPNSPTLMLPNASWLIDADAAALIQSQ